MVTSPRFPIFTRSISIKHTLAQNYRSFWFENDSQLDDPNSPKEYSTTYSLLSSKQQFKVMLDKLAWWTIRYPTYLPIYLQINVSRMKSYSESFLESPLHEQFTLMRVSLAFASLLITTEKHEMQGKGQKAKRRSWSLSPLCPRVLWWMQMKKESWQEV